MSESSDHTHVHHDNGHDTGSHRLDWVESLAAFREQGIASLVVVLVAVVTSLAHEKVKLTGFVVDAMCAASHVKDAPDEAMKFAAEHSKECGLMEECVKSGYGVFGDGKWYPFDQKGSDLTKALFEKTAKKDHLKVIVEGMKHDGKILVQSITEID